MKKLFSFLLFTVLFTGINLQPANASGANGPLVQTLSPAHNATGVSVTPNLIITFDEPIIYVAGKNWGIYKKVGGAEVNSGTIASSSVSGSTLSIAPTWSGANALEYSTEYYVSFSNGAVTNSTPQPWVITYLTPNSWAFTTQGPPDTAAPTLSTSSPAGGATNVAVDSNLTLTFNEYVNGASMKFVSIYKSSDNSLVETVVTANEPLFSTDHLTFTFNPTANLLVSTDYYVLIDAEAFQDTSYNKYAGIASTTALNFTTAAAPDTSAPTMTHVPTDNATGVITNANLVLTFSEPVTAVATKNIVIKKTSDSSVIETIAADSAAVATASNVVTINPSVTFANSTEYFVIIDSGAFKDAANNNYAGITSTTAFSFTTEAASSGGSSGGGTGGGTVSPPVVVPPVTAPLPTSPAPVDVIPTKSIPASFAGTSTSVSAGLKSKLNSEAKAIKSGKVTSLSLKVDTKSVSASTAKARAAALVKQLQSFGLSAAYVKKVVAGKITYVVSAKKK